MSNKPQRHEEEKEIKELSRQVLIDSRRKYKDIVDNLPHCIFLKDKNGVYISCNKAFADDRGKEVNEIQGLTDYDLFPRHLATQYQERDQQVLQADTRVEYEEYYPARESYEIVKILRIPVHGDQDRIIGVLGVLWSITKEKQFENALLEKEMQFRRFIDKATDAITLTDMKGKIVDANQKACEVLGYTYAELTAAHMDKIDPVIWSPNSSSPIWKKLSAEESVITESGYYRKDGSSFQVEISMGLHKEAGKHLVLSIARDITPRHLALRQRASLGKIIEDSLNETYILLRDKLQFLQANRGARENIGFNAEELKTKTISDLCPELTDKIFRERIKPLESGTQDRIHFETVFRRKNGTTYPADVFVQAAEYLFYPVYVIHALDITTLKENEFALRRSKDQWERTFHAIPDIVALLDPDLRIVRINEAGCRQFGLPGEQLIGRKCHELFEGLDTQCLGCPTTHCLEDFNPYTKEIYHEKLHKTFLITSSRIPDEQHGVANIVLVVKDITERKKLEEQLFQTEKLATIAGLAAGVAHEINTPLSAILQSILVINNSLDSGRPDNQKTAAACGIDLDKVNEYFRQTEIDFFLNGMRESAIKASNIIANLLEFSRPQQGDMRMVDLNELLDSTISLARADYDLKKKYDILNLTIQREYDSELPPVTCMPMEIEQVILNLVKNAVQAVVDGGSAEKPRLILRTKKEDGFVRIEVEDNGPGIGEEEQKHIFDPFYTTKEVGVGTGLGLSVSFAIIHDKHHGAIEVESAPGNGAKFIVKIPVDKTADI